VGGILYFKIEPSILGRFHNFSFFVCYGQSSWHIEKSWQISWFSILEHLFFNYFTYGNINMHHIHIHNDCFCLSNKSNFYYYHKFPIKHFLHLSKLWTFCNFMSIQTINMTCICICLLCFLI